MYATHPVSGITVKVLSPAHGLWAFLFGFLYYAAKGAWGWAVVSFFTLNGLFIGLPLYNREIIRSSYEQKGWVIEET